MSTSFGLVVHERPEPAGPDGSVPDYRSLADTLGHQLVVVTFGTKALRRLCRQCVGADERVVEIGASYAACSRVLAARAEAYLGLDNSYECVEACRAALREVPRARFERLDALVERGLLAAHLEREAPTLLVIDVGGSRALGDVMELVDFCVAELARRPPRAAADAARARQPLLLVKSEQLTRAAASRVGAGSGEAAAGEAVACGRGDGWWEECRRQCAAREGGLRSDKRAGVDIELRAAPWYPAKAAGGITICRFHNYSEKGCSKGRSNACPYDHAHCHHCLAPGHIALACEAFIATLSPHAAAAAAGRRDARGVSIQSISAA